MRSCLVRGVPDQLDEDPAGVVSGQRGAHMGTDEAAVGSDTVEAITAAATDYIESWLDGDPERMSRCLHPELVKREVRYDGTFAVESMTREEMVQATAAGYGRKYERPFEVTVLDVFGNVASARVLSAAYLDHLQVARFAEGWQILNVLWQRRPGR